MKSNSLHTKTQSLILYPNFSYSALYVGIAIFFCVNVIVVTTKLYSDITRQTNSDITFGVGLSLFLISFIIYSFSNSYARKIVILHSVIENKRGFPLTIQTIHKKDITGHRIIDSEVFTGGRGFQDQRIEFLGENNTIISTWNVNGFKKSELQKIFTN